MLATSSVNEHDVAFVLLGMAVILLVARLVGSLFRRLNQPAVVGEIIAGILLGPTLLGSGWVKHGLGLSRNLTDVLFPLDSRAYLKVLAELGLVLFMFIVGLELDARLIKGRESTAVTVSLASVCFPFALGVGLAKILESAGFKPDGVGFVPFSLFVGASMSVTAFPVLARLLSERNMARTPLGALTLACAAVDDILAWSLLALVTAIVEADAVAGSGNSMALTSLARVLGLSLLFVGAMFTVVRPLLRRLLDSFRRTGGQLTPVVISVVLGGILVSSFITSRIGIHSIFGAFVMGAVMPREGAEEFTHQLLERIESVAVLALLPLFFIVAGISADVTTIDASGLGVLSLIILTAFIGKFVGAFLAGRFRSLPTRQAGALGILMNTRGLTELVLLSIGLDKGVLSRELFTMLVLMAIVTTVMTAPVLRRIYPDRLVEADIAEAERRALGDDASFRVLAQVDDAELVTPHLEVAARLARSAPSGVVVLSHLKEQPPDLEVGNAVFATRLALMADELDELGGLDRRIAATGATVATHSQFTTDRTGDLLRQARRQDSRALVIGDQSDETLRRVVAEAPCEVLVVIGGGAVEDATEGTRVRLALSGGASDEAAIDVATRLAPPGTAALVASTPTRVRRRMQHELERRGVALALEDEPSRPGDLEVRPTSPETLGSDVDAARRATSSGGAAIILVRRDGAPIQPGSEEAADRHGQVTASA